MHLIDTHAHLDDEQFDSDRPDAVARAREAGVSRILVPGIDLKSSEKVMELTREFPSVFGAVGIHPNSAAGFRKGDLKRIQEWRADPKTLAVGEIGLDYHWDFAGKEDQWAALEAQLDLAREVDLPVILHNRESSDDLMALVELHQDGRLRGVFHCFPQDGDLLRRALDLGFFVSFTGNVTYRKPTRLGMLKEVPLDHLLLETDTPYMTPVPHRGQRNEPAYVVHVAQCIADALELEVEEVARRTTENARALFGFPGSSS